MVKCDDDVDGVLSVLKGFLLKGLFLFGGLCGFGVVLLCMEMME